MGPYGQKRRETENTWRETENNETENTSEKQKTSARNRKTTAENNWRETKNAGEKHREIIASTKEYLKDNIVPRKPCSENLGLALPVQLGEATTKERIEVADVSCSNATCVCVCVCVR